VGSGEEAECHPDILNIYKLEERKLKGEGGERDGPGQYRRLTMGWENQGGREEGVKYHQRDG